VSLGSFIKNMDKLTDDDRVSMKNKLYALISEKKGSKKQDNRYSLNRDELVIKRQPNDEKLVVEHLYMVINMTVLITNFMSAETFYIANWHFIRLITEKRPLPVPDTHFFRQIMLLTWKSSKEMNADENKWLELKKTVDLYKQSRHRNCKGDNDLNRYKLDDIINSVCKQMETAAKNQLEKIFYMKCVQYYKGLCKAEGKLLNRSKEEIETKQKLIHKDRYTRDMNNVFLKQFYNVKSKKAFYNPERIEEIKKFNKDNVEKSYEFIYDHTQDDPVDDESENDEEEEEDTETEKNKSLLKIDKISYDFHKSEKYYLLFYVLENIENERQRLLQEKEDKKKPKNDKRIEDKIREYEEEIVENENICENDIITSVKERVSQKNVFGKLFSLLPLPNFGINQIPLSHSGLYDLMVCIKLVQPLPVPKNKVYYHNDEIKKTALGAFFNTDFAKINRKKNWKETVSVKESFNIKDYFKKFERNEENKEKYEKKNRESRRIR